MQTIILNNHEYNITRYARYTEVLSNRLYSVATVVFPDAVHYSELESMAGETITDIQIKINNTVIYHLEEVDAHIDRLNEELSGEEMSMSILIGFRQDGKEEIEENNKEI